MNAHSEKTVNKKVPQTQSCGESVSQFVDNRPEAIVQRKLQEMANNSSRAMQLQAFQDMANNSPQAKRSTQLQAKSVQMKTKNKRNIRQAAASPVVQRLIFIKTEGFDFGLIIDVYQMLRNGIDSRVAIEEMMGNFSYNKGETLYPVGHGSAEDKKFADLSPSQLAQIILRPNNFSDLEKIDLLSCELGRGEAKSFAAELFKEVGGMKDIIAYNDLNNTDSKGESHNKPEGGEQEIGYKEIFSKYKDLIGSLQEEYSSENISGKLNIQPNDTPEQVALKIKALGGEIWGKSQELFEELYEHNQKFFNDKEGRFIFAAQ